MTDQNITDLRFTGSGEFPISSPELDKLCPAMCKAQKAIKHASKDKQNKFLAGSDGKGGYYADLASVMDACIEALNTNGLFVAQPVQRTTTGETVLVTRLYHESGQFLQSVILLSTANRQPAAEADEGPKIPGTDKKKESNTVQKTVAEITYLRRACLSALVGVAADDDDGNEAEGAPQQRAPQRPQAAPPAPGGAPRIGPR